MEDASPRLLYISGTLPFGFDALREAAAAEGYRFLDRLATDWDEGTIRFDRPGEMLLAAEANGTLAAIGGLTIDPTLPSALRMRRFYVRPQFRRTGIGRELAVTLLASPVRAAGAVTVNAATGSAPFWESLGFVPDLRDGHTHVLIGRGTDAPRLGRS
jgi:GNAT superfamily N-acetyltransferase